MDVGANDINTIQLALNGNTEAEALLFQLRGCDLDVEMLAHFEVPMSCCTRRAMSTSPANLPTRRATEVAIADKASSAADSSCSRFLRRSSQRRGVKHTSNRSPANASLRIFATSLAINCDGSSSAVGQSSDALMSFRMSAVVSAVIQSTSPVHIVARTGAPVLYLNFHLGLICACQLLSGVR